MFEIRRCNSIGATEHLTDINVKIESDVGKQIFLLD